MVDVGGTGEFTAEMLCAFMEMTDSELEIIDEKDVDGLEEGGLGDGPEL